MRLRFLRLYANLFDRQIDWAPVEMNQLDMKTKAYSEVDDWYQAFTREGRSNAIGINHVSRASGEVMYHARQVGHAKYPSSQITSG